MLDQMASGGDAILIAIGAQIIIITD